MGECLCFEKNNCKLRNYAELTLRHINEVLEEDLNKDKKELEVHRVMRGAYHVSPGFLDDWLLSYAINNDKIKELIEDIVGRNEISLDFLCGYCQLYRGPKR